MKKILMAVIAIIMTVGTLSAQQNMYVWKTDGTYVPFSVSEVDSIGFYLPASMTVNTKGVGVFSVSETKKVTFSPGNLQYQASTDRWRFAEHQWDIVGIGYGVTNEEEYCFIGGTVKGSDNRQISDTYTGWIDLFGWGTGDAPTKSHDNMSEYANFTDWGTNWIGSDAPNTWHTLSSDEWGYLFYERPNANNKYGAAKVNGMVGMVILPDKWTMPDGCDFEPGMVDVVTPLEEGTEEYTNFVNSGQVWNRVVLSNYYDGDKWQAMEDNGAVFLPAAGYRELTNVIYFGLVGHYWSSSFFMPSLLAYPVIFGSYLLFGNQMTHFSCTGKAVRLVSELPAPSYILTITTEGEGVVRGAGTYKENEKATLVATPEEGWQFVQWSDGNTSNPRSIKMTQNLTYTALFTEMNDIGDGDDNTEDDDTFGAFSVSATEKVIFSPGNLQFNAAEGSHLSAESPLCDGYMFPGTWRFAENQWDIIGLGYGQTDTEEGCVIGGTVQNGDNRQLSYNYDGWIDLFGFGTSGWISGAYEYNPWGASVNCNDYYPGTSPSNNLTGDCAYADWGVYNQIGDDAPGTWRTLTKDEWVYLLGSRPNAGSKYGAAKVNGVTGIVLLPNKWTLPDGCSFAPGMTMAGDWKDWSMVAVTNIYEGKQWEAMEDNGAVFLPCAGTRNGTSMRGTGTFGFYWTSTACSSEHAYGMQFISYYMNWQRTLRYTGSSVLLVRDIQKEYTLSVTTEGEGTVTGDGTYKPGDVAT
ncbi:MAG: hypothetical protein J6Y00_03325, partial [Paludibacteraceae bacterium]|nr:hypothetical protein [Paludibacteraceae bacterium]